MKPIIDINKFRSEFYGVVNLSNYSCNQNALSMLGKGLKFCPTPPKYCHGIMKESVDRFFRSASMKLFFVNNSAPENPEDILENSFLSEPEEDTAFEHKELKLPSSFNPPMLSTLEHIYDILIDKILSHSLDFSRRRNMTLEQYKAMTRLKENMNIVIKKADKGSNVVIQNKSDFTKESLRQLSESKFYKQIDENLTSTHRKLIQDFIGEVYLRKKFQNIRSNSF